MQYIEILIYGFIAVIVVYIVKSRRPTCEGMNGIHQRNSWFSRNEMVKNKLRDITSSNIMWKNPEEQIDEFSSGCSTCSRNPRMMRY